MTVRNVSRGTLLADRADVANTSAKRRTGLLKHAGLANGEGLWITPCEGVHTFGMQFPIDVLFLNKKKVVLKVRKNMARRRFSLCLRASSVLELPVGMIELTRTQPGDQLELVRA